MLDTLSLAEAWRRYSGGEPFSQSLYARAAAAAQWLGAMIDPDSGDGPNLGPNDGAYPYRLDSSAYRDFRTSLQLASRLFMHDAALPSGSWDEAAAWLGISVERPTLPWLNNLGSAVFREGGYVVLRNQAGARALLRTPTAHFRPAHGDALHLDLWWKGSNMLRDGGTYTYAGDALAEELASVVGHNTLQFDGHDQMPRLGRFLYGSWVKVNGDPVIAVSADRQSWAGEYMDHWGAQHKRTVTRCEILL